MESIRKLELKENACMHTAYMRAPRLLGGRLADGRTFQERTGTGKFSCRPRCQAKIQIHGTYGRHALHARELGASGSPASGLLLPAAGGLSECSGLCTTTNVNFQNQGRAFLACRRMDGCTAASEARPWQG